MISSTGPLTAILKTLRSELEKALGLKMYTLKKNIYLKGRISIAFFPHIYQHIIRGSETSHTIMTQKNFDLLLHERRWHLTPIPNSVRLHHLSSVYSCKQYATPPCPILANNSLKGITLNLQKNIKTTNSKYNMSYWNQPRAWWNCSSFFFYLSNRKGQVQQHRQLLIHFFHHLLFFSFTNSLIWCHVTSKCHPSPHFFCCIPPVSFPWPSSPSPCWIWKSLPLYLRQKEKTADHQTLQQQLGKPAYPSIVLDIQPFHPLPDCLFTAFPIPTQDAQTHGARLALLHQSESWQ